MGQVVDMRSFRKLKQGISGTTISDFKPGELDDNRWKAFQDLAYDWAESEIAKLIYFTSIKLRVQERSTHEIEAFFQKEGKDPIYLVYNEQTRWKQWWRIANYDELKEESGDDEIDSYLRAGVYSYFAEKRPAMIKKTFVLPS